MLVSLAVDTSAQRCTLAALAIGLLGLAGCSALPTSTAPIETAASTIESAPAPPTDAASEEISRPSAIETTPAASAPAPAPAVATPPLPSFTPAARVQRVAPFRHVSEFMSAADWQNLKADTVGLKICAPAASAEKTVEIADPSPVAMLNEAAIAWGKASQWEVVNGEGASFPVCTFVIARFGR